MKLLIVVYDHVGKKHGQESKDVIFADNRQRDKGLHIMGGSGENLVKVDVLRTHIDDAFWLVAVQILADKVFIQDRGSHIVPKIGVNIFGIVISQADCTVITMNDARDIIDDYR